MQAKQTARQMAKEAAEAAAKAAADSCVICGGEYGAEVKASKQIKQATYIYNSILYTICSGKYCTGVRKLATLSGVAVTEKKSEPVQEVVRDQPLACMMVHRLDAAHQQAPAANALCCCGLQAALWVACDSCNR